ncbi:DsbC family protein [Paucibacter soli]|uniref:DsbC family protein n=1 Tax=Paucibacter soli TaxID=3133433 RepID=UPI00309E96AD
MKHSIRALGQSIAVLSVLLSAGISQASDLAKLVKPLPLLPAAPSAPTSLPEVSAAEKQRVTDIMGKKLGMTPSRIESSPIAGFYEVTVLSNIYYVDRDGKWLFDGHLVDMDTKRSLTAAKKADLATKGLPPMDWRSLNLADAIKTTLGQATPGRVLVTFEDPNCGYCKKLHPELAKIQNLTVYTFPVSVLGPASEAKNNDLWCAKDRVAAWTTVMQGGDVKADGECDTSAIKRNGLLAQRLGVSGTPTIFLADGSRVPGYIDAAAIEAKLALQK